MTMQGIDVSNYKNIDTSLARDFVVVQTTWGTGQANNVNLVNGVSQLADRQIIRAKSSGKKLGVMHYYMGGDVNAEAEFFAQHNRQYFGLALPCIDWEITDNPRVNDTELLSQLLDAFEKVLGGKGVVYISASRYANLHTTIKNHGWLTWVAQYATSSPTGIQETPWNDNVYDAILRQYSDNGQIGAGTEIDLDKFYGSPDDWDELVKKSVGITQKIGAQEMAAPFKAIIQINDEKRLQYFDGARLHPLTDPDQVVALQTVAKACGFQLPCLKLGTNKAPMGTRLEQALN